MDQADAEPDNLGFDCFDCDFIEDNFLNNNDSNKTIHQNLDHIVPYIPPNSKFLNPNWILLDNQSTVHIFHNIKLLGSIAQVSSHDKLVCHSNGVSQTSVHQAQFREFGSVWFNRNSLANILSFTEVRKSLQFHIAYDYSKNIFVVTLPDKTVMPFIQTPRGLYHHDVRWNPKCCQAFSFDNTVQDNMNMFTPRQVKKA